MKKPMSILKPIVAFAVVFPLLLLAGCSGDAGNSGGSEPSGGDEHGGAEHFLLDHGTPSSALEALRRELVIGAV